MDEWQQKENERLAKFSATKWLCNECDWKGPGEKVLRAPNPFTDGKETMYGCPDCREPNTMEAACDEPNCWQRATCGTPTLLAYRHTCYKHKPD